MGMMGGVMMSQRGASIDVVVRLIVGVIVAAG